MVSEEYPTNTHSSILHQFIIANSMNGARNQLGSENFDGYDADTGAGCAFNSFGSIPGSMPSFQAAQVMDQSNERTIHAQRLSLSLGTCTLVFPVQEREKIFNSALMNPPALMPQVTNARTVSSHPGSYYISNDYPPAGSGSAFSSGLASRTEYLALTVGNSKFLRPAQSLLDEVVKVSGNAIDLMNEKYVKRLSSDSKWGSLKLRSELNAELSNNECYKEKHGLHAQLLKLIALLEEVERRYGEYHNHMDELVSSFESIAGLGAGECYAALALQAMSRHFCSLRDAILSQISVVKQKLSPSLPKISTAISHLHLFEHKTRHNLTSLQQLGMIQSSRQAWRPIRGLPDTSVAILRSWLFEHFLHPYPTDTEKFILASQTGLNKNQVSNWFINARVRLWKPMIEEIYNEEFADSSVETNPSLKKEGSADSTED